MKYVIALSGNPDYPWMHGEQLLFWGEIENCKGRGVYMQHSGKFHHGYHLDNFFEYTDTHYDVSERYGHCMSDFFRLQHGVFCLRYDLVDLLIELNESHTPEAAEKSFVMQASKIVFPNI